MMRRTVIMLGFCAVAAAWPAPYAHAIDIATLLNNTDQPGILKLIHVADLSAMMRDSSHRLRIYDANTPQVREAFGVIPGAYPLGSSDRYDVSAALPKDKDAKLVFYCRNHR